MKLFIVHSDIILCRDFGPTYRDTSSLESSRIQLYHWGAVVPSSSLLYYVPVLRAHELAVLFSREYLVVRLSCRLPVCPLDAKWPLLQYIVYH